MDVLTSFLGTGWKFPIQFTKTTGNVEMLSDEDDIQSSLHVLLLTRIGERIMQPSYGCNLDVLMFEAINESLIAYVRDLVFTAVYYYEPRINPEDVSVTATEDEGIVLVDVEYTIRTTNSRHNLVFPFYLDEGNLVINSGA